MRRPGCRPQAGCALARALPAGTGSAGGGSGNQRAPGPQLQGEPAAEVGQSPRALRKESREAPAAPRAPSGLCLARALPAGTGWVGGWSGTKRAPGPQLQGKPAAEVGGSRLKRPGRSLVRRRPRCRPQAGCALAGHRPPVQAQPAVGRAPDVHLDRSCEESLPPRVDSSNGEGVLSGVGGRPESRPSVPSSGRTGVRAGWLALILLSILLFVCPGHSYLLSWVLWALSGLPAGGFARIYNLQCLKKMLKTLIFQGHTNLNIASNLARPSM
jgi:hypothetical protein